MTEAYKEQEFCLSDEILHGTFAGTILVEDVRLFIEKLKEEFQNDSYFSDTIELEVIKKIDKLAGDKLTKPRKELQ